MYENDLYCPSCGEPMEHWNQGVYSCEDCDIMIDSEILDDDDLEF